MQENSDINVNCKTKLLKKQDVDDTKKLVTNYNRAKENSIAITEFNTM